MKKKSLKILSIALLIGLSGAVSAASTSWSFTSTATSSVGAPGFASQVAEFSSMTYTNGAGNSVTMNAFANTATNAKIEAAYLNYQGSSGLGVTSRDSSTNDEVNTNGTLNGTQHSFDNQGAVESILFSFSSAFTMEQLDFGWTTNDSDIQLYAYTSNTAFTTGTILTKDYSTLTGWTKIGDFTGPTDPRLTTNSTYSRYWLVTPGPASDKLDYVKLAGITGSYKPTQPPSTGVPEPESLALVGVALAGMILTRRRKSA
ncbi:exosortase-dependent surface protein XDP1 [Methyloversatilis sp.]|uniref:exosortase-dependent surface protein XDP1 n=1 Tax=Methyloversatilis sp. TaxID=2569862 RepID=UPI002732C4F3|nr:exosortase-dependent surface protein XDP1 [Methyloversatilis sp.]MDP2869310.1 exosortase-dependent surface protein XDP1 [Methyloversatilis sp.]MDP3287140.1 exosortase-dependent surface protein XDP1 [Methyloversatilis sp.]MDP3456895.1 exosortase-dependent surface protein XDP1 [Methyloversatilis sp.]MDP3580095.1 exosortase-dependent surface protein XDP1 [Methyloversatilis sp.]